jgi:hypothetical protein
MSASYACAWTATLTGINVRASAATLFAPSRFVAPISDSMAGLGTIAALVGIGGITGDDHPVRRTAT